MHLLLLVGLVLIVGAKSSEARIEFCRSDNQMCLDNCLHQALQTIEVDDGYVCISQNYSKCNVTVKGERQCAGKGLCSSLNDLLKPDREICLPLRSKLLEIDLSKRLEGQTCLSSEMCSTSSCEKNGKCADASVNSNKIQLPTNIKQKT